ncbi:MULTISPECIES: hypothetical protein [Serratia]|uniref:hypothetical protein n=1 Tax=Serratia TaxID=613 RepID=UPI0015B8EDCC|nr:MULTISPECIES: hypothetical protein [Serratia]
MLERGGALATAIVPSPEPSPTGRGDWPCYQLAALPVYNTVPISFVNKLQMASYN